MDAKRFLSLLQVFVLVGCTVAVWQFSQEGDQSDNGEDYSIEVVDSNGIFHSFNQPPSRVAITNTYAGTVMRMLNVSSEVIVGVSGDFYDDTMWPEYSDTTKIQQSAHSEIDFETLLDVRPDVYIVFATNGMVDTAPIRALLEPLGIHVLALDFYKYDTLRYEIQIIADLFDKQPEAMALFDEFDAIESMVNDRIQNIGPEERPDVVMEHHASLTRDPVVLTGTSQWTDLIQRAGGTNVFADLPGHTTHVDMEAILDANPNLIMFDGITFDIGFNAYDQDGTCETHFDYISERPGFDSIDAVQDDRMLVMSGEFAGPMMIHGLPTLAKQIHPELFADVDASDYLDQYFLTYHGVHRIGKFVCSMTGE